MIYKDAVDETAQKTEEQMRSLLDQNERLENDKERLTQRVAALKDLLAEKERKQKAGAEKES